MSSLTPRKNFEKAMSLLHSGQAEVAAEVCQAALALVPDDLDLLTLHGVVLLDCRKPGEAIKPLSQAVRLAPRFARARENLGQALMQVGRLDEAVEQLQSAAELEPASESVRLKLAHALANGGKADEADAVYEQAFGLAPNRLQLALAGEHLRAGRVFQCEQICRELLAVNSDDVNALRLMSKVAGDSERWGQSAQMLLRALEIAPDFHDARLDLAMVYKQQDRLEEALVCTVEAVERNPRNAYALYLNASMLAILARHEDALKGYRKAIEARAYHPAAYVGIGHLQKTLGRSEEGVEAYRTAIAQRPNFGEVYWSLANLKTFRFTEAEMEDMERRLCEETLSEDARVHFMFTLGKAYEDMEEFERSFTWYDEACSIQRMRITYDPVDTELMGEAIRDVIDRDFLAQHSGQGCLDPTPIFIVGLPRSGSTLIEQILASHSQVEGTAELPDVGRTIGNINRQFPREKYPKALRQLDAEALREMGETYLQRTLRHRSGLPRFTDKMPNNFASIGLIHLMLPNATIIDARRHPLDSCFGSFKQHFAHGQTFSYDLVELGEFYLEYRRMMRHWENVLPGKVLEVHYENVVRNQEAETRRILDHCGLAFEEACLRFYETERAVRTASSEQVRQPIYDSSLNHWRNFRHQLEPLIEVLGGELDDWDH